MNEPQRLLDNTASGSALEKELLRSAREDAPCVATKASAMAALGIAGGLAAATQATAANAAIQTAAAQGAASTTAAAASTTAAAASTTAAAASTTAAAASTAAAAASTAAAAASTAAGAAVSLGKGVVLVKWVGIASVGLVGSATVIDHVTEPASEPPTATIVSSVQAQSRPPRPRMTRPNMVTKPAPTRQPQCKQSDRHNSLPRALLSRIAAQVQQ